MKELKIRKCNKCEALIEVLDDCSCEDCGIKCCGEVMDLLESNSVEASFEKHMPAYKIENDQITITVNHVMEEKHYIKWIKVVTKEIEITKNLKPNEEIKLVLPVSDNMVIYSYCNLHGLWKNEVE